MKFIFECEICKKQYKNRIDFLKCEAAHLGLTLDEKIEYDKLKKRARYAGAVISRRKNKETEKEFDEAIEKLLSFEKEHGIEFIE